MSLSLSVILPVCNAEEKLTIKINELLEVISDLTHDFEVLIVDDGSTDNTEETAMELCRQFPQISSLRHTQCMGEMGAARAGISRTVGEVVLIHDIEEGLSGDALRQFWAMRNDKDLVYARTEPAHRTRVRGLHKRKSGAWSGTQMLRREAVSELQGTGTRPRVDRVTRTDLAEAESTPSVILRQLTTGSRSAVDT